MFFQRHSSTRSSWKWCLFFLFVYGQWGQVLLEILMRIYFSTLLLLCFSFCNGVLLVLSEAWSSYVPPLRGRASQYKECNFCTAAAPFIHYEILHLEQMIIAVARYLSQILLPFQKRLSRLYLFELLVTPDSAPLGPALPCRQVNTHVVLYWRTGGTSRCSLYYHVVCPHMTPSLLSQQGTCIKPVTHHCQRQCS